MTPRVENQTKPGVGHPLRSLFGALVMASGAHTLVMALLYVFTDTDGANLWWLRLPVLACAAWFLGQRDDSDASLPMWGAAVIVGLGLSVVGNWVMVSPLTERDLRVDVEILDDGSSSLFTGGASGIESICIGGSCTSVNPISEAATFQTEARGRTVEVLIVTSVGERRESVSSRAGCIELSWAPGGHTLSRPCPPNPDSPDGEVGG